MRLVVLVTQSQPHLGKGRPLVESTDVVEVRRVVGEPMERRLRKGLRITVLLGSKVTSWLSDVFPHLKREIVGPSVTFFPFLIRLPLVLAYSGPTQTHIGR